MHDRIMHIPDKDQDNVKPHVLIIGITGSIGHALADAYQKTHQVVGVARNIHNADHQFQIVQSDYSEKSLPKLYTSLNAISESYAVIINCIGLLHNANLQPEKRLEHITERGLSEYFYVNSTLPALLIKYLHTLLPKHQRSVFANLSAMVGSISDNKLGGWYGYRASKAALNMLVKTSAIELARSYKHAAIIAVHPGTTKSRLSAPFTQATAPEKLYSVELTANRLIQVINSADVKQSGQFFHWNGDELKW